MRKLIYLLLLLLIATPCFGQDMARMSLGVVGSGTPVAAGGSPPTYVNTKGNQGYNSTAITTGNFVATAGNTLVLFVSSYTGAGYKNISTIADTAGNTYTLVTSVTYDTNLKMWVYKSVGILGSATNNITVTFDGQDSYPTIAVNQYSGATGVDLYGSTSAIGTSVSINTATTNYANETIVAGVRLNGPGTRTAGSGYTIRFNAYNDYLICTEDKSVTSVGVYAVDMSWVNSDFYLFAYATVY
jgi:hypothetical protein